MESKNDIIYCTLPHELCYKTSDGACKKLKAGTKLSVIQKLDNKVVLRWGNKLFIENNDKVTILKS